MKAVSSQTRVWLVRYTYPLSCGYLSVSRAFGIRKVLHNLVKCRLSKLWPWSLWAGSSTPCKQIHRSKKYRNCFSVLCLHGFCCSYLPEMVCHNLTIVVSSPGGWWRSQISIRACKEPLLWQGCVAIENLRCPNSLHERVTERPISSIFGSRWEPDDWFHYELPRYRLASKVLDHCADSEQPTFCWTFQSLFLFYWVFTSALECSLPLSLCESILTTASLLASLSSTNGRTLTSKFRDVRTSAEQRICFISLNKFFLSLVIFLRLLFHYIMQQIGDLSKIFNKVPVVIYEPGNCRATSGRLVLAVSTFCSLSSVITIPPDETVFFSKCNQALNKTADHQALV